MDSFETFVSKHGETGAQALLENWERFMGIMHPVTLSLERRWEIFIGKTSFVAAA